MQPKPTLQKILKLPLICGVSLHSPPPAYIHSNQIMGWGEKAIEIRSVETGHLDGVFMHKRAQRLKFLCERNDKVSLQPKYGIEGKLPSKLRVLVVIVPGSRCSGNNKLSAGQNVSGVSIGCKMS